MKSETMQWKEHEREEETMNKTTFNETLKSIVAQKLGEAYSVTLTTVTKVNQTLDALVVCKENNPIGVTIYLNDSFKKYSSGRADVKEIAEDLLSTYSFESMEASLSMSDLDFLKDKNSILDKIIYKVINRDKNQTLLSNVPHTTFLEDSDLVLIYAIVVTDSSNGIASITITNQLMEHFNLSEQEIYTNAKRNTPELLPPTFQSFQEILTTLMPLVDEQFEIPMWVLTNRPRVNGASALCYDETLARIGEALDSNYYILPSSLHELVIVRDNEQPCDELKEMVQLINATEVSDEDFLSDTVFYYNYTNHQLSVA